MFRGSLIPLIVSMGFAIGGDACLQQQPTQSHTVQTAEALQPEAAGPAHQGIQDTQSQPCDVKSVELVGAGKEYLTPDWSHRLNRVAFVRRRDYNEYDSKGMQRFTYDLYTMNPDATGERCLSCTTSPGGPSWKRMMGFPSWHPSGDWILLQVEMGGLSSWVQVVRSLAGPDLGYYNNMWVVSADGSKWHRLTNYHGDHYYLKEARNVKGVLTPRFSPDGTTVVWSKVVSGPGKGNHDIPCKDDYFENPIGVFELWRADFVVNAQGFPELKNARDITPRTIAGKKRGNWFEVGGFSPHGKEVLFSSDIGLHKTATYKMDIWSMDLGTGRLTRLTGPDEEWDEHAHYSPDGKKIAFLSSSPFQDWSPSDIATQRCELFLMNPDGGNRSGLTHFNAKGCITGKRCSAGVSAWSPYGTQILINQGTRSDDPCKPVFPPFRRLVRLTFEGACGCLSGNCPEPESRSLETQSAGSLEHQGETEKTPNKDKETERL